MYIYNAHVIYIHACTFVYTCTFIYIYVHFYAHMYIYIHIYIVPGSLILFILIINYRTQDNILEMIVFVFNFSV